MNATATERESTWDAFLQRWPLENLSDLTLEKYTTAGSDDCFVYWMESRTDSLGSIWGGSAFKFGIYSRKNKTDKSPEAGRSYSDDYAWYSKYGNNEQEAFARVKALVVQVAKAARAGELDQIEGVDLGHAFKWKLAFLYQDRSKPVVLPIYTLDSLRAAVDDGASKSTHELHAELMRQRSETPFFDFADRQWALAVERLAHSKAVREILERFEVDPRFKKVEWTVEQRTLFYRLAVAAHERGLDWWTTKMDQGGSIRLGRNNSMTSSETAVLALIDPQKSGVKIRFNERITDQPEWQALTEAVVADVEDPEFSSDFVASNPIDRAARWPTDYQAEVASATHQDEKKLPAMDEKRIDIALNQILYGPPGTGKTYTTIEAALEILDFEYLKAHQEDPDLLKTRFDELAAAGRVRFVTFHQSFSYEDFVEGLRAESDEATGQLVYDIVDGVFKSFCEAASAKVTQQAEAPLDLTGRKIWKMSLGNTLGSDAGIYEECLQGGYVLLGYGGSINFSGCTNQNEVQKCFAKAGVDVNNPKDYSLTSVSTFVTRMKPGDLVVVSDGNFKFRAIGEISGDYAFKQHPEYEEDYSQMRPVKWLRQYTPSLPFSELMNNRFIQKTLYELRSPSLNLDKLRALLGSGTTKGVQASHAFQIGQVFGADYRVLRATPDVLELKKPNGKMLGLAMSLLHDLAGEVSAGRISVADIREKRVFERLPNSDLEPNLVNGYHNILAPLVEHLLKGKVDVTNQPSGNDARVLIIDEINRGNVSRIFGELITLIEPSKRAGAGEALEVLLPYSKKPFSVPDNVYLIGTMNTADRSLAGLDIALRRRFTFREMPPRPDLLDGVDVDGLNIGELLRVMNQRIEVLLDRDHCLGHAYFMPLMNEPTLERLALIFRNQILPLLQEYFFEDWQRIQWVLNDHRKAANHRFVFQRASALANLFGSDVNHGLTDQTWHVNDEAFERLEAYVGVIDPQLASARSSVKREAVHGDLTLRELESGSIEVVREGVVQSVAKTYLRKVAEELGVSQLNSQDNLFNTRALGRKLISQLLASPA